MKLIWRQRIEIKEREGRGFLQRIAEGEEGNWTWSRMGAPNLLLCIGHCGPLRCDLLCEVAKREVGVCRLDCITLLLNKTHK
jgi:hypothetical protein